MSATTTMLPLTERIARAQRRPAPVVGYLLLDDHARFICTACADSDPCLNVRDAQPIRTTDTEYRCERCTDCGQGPEDREDYER